MREWVQANAQFHPASPIWRREPELKTASDQALDKAVAEIDRWIESRADWTRNANEFLDPAAWSGPLWSRDQWQTLRVIIDLALDDD